MLVSGLKHRENSSIMLPKRATSAQTDGVVADADAKDFCGERALVDRSALERPRF
jgi:hypothetical protein